MKTNKNRFFPGTDHGGIATQNVVERSLETPKESIGKEAFVIKVNEFKEQKQSVIIDQLQKLGE